MIRAVALGLLLGAAPMMGQAADSCTPSRVDLRGPGGQARFTVEIADDAAERAQGLMNREKLSASRGMLFIYERPQKVAFWMENTLIPLDMIFISPEGRVMKVHENAVPLDRTTIPGGDDILMVLEINGGLAGRLGIAEGSELRHPALDQTIAVWPCEE